MNYRYRPNAKPRLPDAELRRLYVDERKSANEIAVIADRDAKTVWGWLRAAEIPTRPRGANPAVWFKKGERSAFAGRLQSPEARRKIGEATRRRENKGFMRNGVHYLKGLPKEQHPSWRGGATPERQAFYRGAEWAAACCAVWKRANGCCERCGADYRKADRSTERFHVHHIVTFQCRELRAAPDNLALLCPPCHRFVHSAANIAQDFILPVPTLFDLAALDDAHRASERVEAAE